jgi:hypothetical protein
MTARKSKQDRRPSDRDRAVDAVAVLNDFVGDLVAATNILLDYAERHLAGTFGRDQMITVSNLCLSYLILAFAKFEEFWSHYNDLVLAEHREACKSIMTFIQTRKITNLRNRYVGPIWDNEKRRPLLQSEVRSALNE